MGGSWKHVFTYDPLKLLAASLFELAADLPCAILYYISNTLGVMQ